MKCKRCGKEFYPSMEFLEDTSLLEALAYYFGNYEELEGYCNECLYAIDEKIDKIIKEFKKESAN